MTSPRTKKFLITDIDGCALTWGGPTQEKKNVRDDLLSPHLIEQAKAGDYDGFYLSTHRCFYLALEASLNKQRVSQYKVILGRDYCSDHLLTYRVAENFAAETGLPLLGVSTPDDSSVSANNQCSYGYNNFLKPLEMLMQNANFTNTGLMHIDFIYIKAAFLEGRYNGTMNYFNNKSKNIQLIQIAQDIAKKYPEDTFTMDYFDDQYDLCSNIKMDKPARDEHAKITFERMKNELGSSHIADELYQALGATQLNIKKMPLQFAGLNVFQHAPHEDIYCKKISFVIGTAHAIESLSSSSEPSDFLNQKPIEEQAEVKKSGWLSNALFPAASEKTDSNSSTHDKNRDVAKTPALRF